MAKDIKRHLSHLKSSGATAPAAADLVYGEIAVGYAKDNEALYIKNNSGDVVTFTTAAGSQALAETYTDSHVISNATGDTEITVSLSSVADSGRTLTITHASGSAQSGFKKLSSDSCGHITGGSNVALSDLTGLGALSGVTSGTGIAVGTKSNGAQSISLATTGTAGTYKQVVVDSYGRVTSGNNADNNTFREIKVNGTSFLASSTTTALNLSGGSNVTLTTGSTGLITIAATDTTYTAATAVPNNVATASSVGTSVKYAREDHTHAITLATGDANGQVKIAGTNISVKGLGGAAYLNTGTTSSTVAAGNHTHSNMVTGSSLTANNIIVGNGSSAIKDSGISIETAVTISSDSVVPTSKAIATYVTEQMASALTYKGAISSNDTLKPPYKTGDVWVVSSAGTYAGKACEVGDYLIANKSVETGTSVVNADWDAINGENQVENKAATLAWNSAVTIATVDGTNITAKLPAKPNSNTWRNVKVNGTEKLTTATTSGSLDITSGSTNGTISVAGTDVAVKGLGGAAYLNTGTTSSTVAAGNHTHTTTIASDTGTSQVSLTHGGKFKLTAGGTSYIFTMPSDNNSWRNVTVNGTEKLGTGTNTGSLDFTSGSTNGTISVEGTDVKVTGLGGAAYLNTGTTSSTVAAGNHNHSGTYATNAFSKVKINAEATTIDADTTGDTLTISGGTFISLTSDATNDKFTINVNTGTSSSTVAVGNHTHSAYANQNAFSNIKVGSVTVAADTTTDTVEFSGDTAISIVGDATNDKVTFSLGDIVCGDYA